MITCKITKFAWIRDNKIEAGRPAPGRLNCDCGKAPESLYKENYGLIYCDCGRVFNWEGWIKREKLAQPDNLFIGGVATGEIYCDRSRAEHGDYKKLALIFYETLNIYWYDYENTPADLREYIEESHRRLCLKVGKPFNYSATQTSTLGHKCLDFEAVNKRLRDFLAGELREYGGVSEFKSDKVHDLSFDVIKAYHAKYGAAWLINLNPNYNGHFGFKKWYGENPKNFEFAAVAPCWDYETEKLIIEYQKPVEQGGVPLAGRFKQISTIFERIGEIGGTSLVWS